MISVLIFYAHFVAGSYIFTKRWQEANTAEAFLAVAFMTVVFLVGWSVSTFLLKIVVDPGGLGKLFDRDAMSLTLLTLMEAGLYSLYYRRQRRDADTKGSE